MKPLFIAETSETPKIDFVFDNQTFLISGKSLPENAIEFYEPVFDWLDEYAKHPLDKSIFDFDLEYFNTASAKQIGKILLILKRISESSDMLIRWHYDKEDIGMLQSGKRYEKLIKLDFEYLAF